MNMKIYEIENYLADIFKKNKLLKDSYSVLILHIVANAVFHNHPNNPKEEYIIYISCLQHMNTQIPFGIRRRKFLETLLNKQLKYTTYNLHCDQEDLDKLYVLSKIMQ